MKSAIVKDTSLGIKPIFRGFSAIIGGLELSAPINPEMINQITNYWLEYPVLVLKKQNISDSQ